MDLGSLFNPSTLISIVIPVLFLYFSLIRPAQIKNKLIKNGKNGSGVILQVTDTGSTTNDSPLVKVLLKIKPEDGTEEFEATAKTYVPRINPGKYQPGMQVTVKYDFVKKQAAIIES